MDQIKYAIDFSSYITERTMNFSGREWVFQAINEWLADPNGSRFFLLKGKPGSGKTAISARLSQFSQGLPPPYALPHLTQGYLSAIHFCSARETTWVDPLIFAGSLATQLANRYPAYLKLLGDLNQDKQIAISVKQDVQQVINGQVIGAVINVSGPSPESAFNRVVREPLKALLDGGMNEQIVILVDSLDEALSYSGIPTIVSLLSRTDQLSSQVRFLLTTRDEERVENQFLMVNELSLSIPGDQRNQDDIRRYVVGRLQNDLQLAEKAAQVETTQVNELVEAVPDKAEGNFLYISFLLDAMAKGLRSLIELDGLPIGLDWLYFDSLRRVVDLGKRDWFNEYRHLMGVLSVAQEGLSLAQLQAFTSQPESSIWQYLSDLQQFIQKTNAPKGQAEQETRYSLYHQSFIDFLGRQRIFREQGQSTNNYYISPDEWHKKLAKVCEQGNLSIIWDDIKRNLVEQSRREYARHYYITHLYLAQEWQQLFDVLDQEQYGKAKVSYDPSTHTYTQDLDIGRRVATWEGYTLEEGIALLPQLWRFTLLRCSLTNRADLYPPSAFKLLMLLNREQKAQGLVELLTDASHKLQALLQIAELRSKLFDREQEYLHILTSAWEISRTITRGWAARDVAIAFAQAQLWERAREVVHTIQDGDQRAWVSRELVTVLAQMQQWDQAETLMGTMEEGEAHAWAQSDLVAAFAKAQLWERAEALISAIRGSEQRAWAMRELVTALAKVQLWERAEASLLMILDNEQRAWAQSELAVAFAQAHLWERAQEMWAEAESLIQTIEGEQEWRDTVVIGSKSTSTLEGALRKDRVLEALGRTYTRAQQWDRAQGTINLIKGKFRRIKALGDLGLALALVQQSERIENVVIALNELKSKEEEEDSSNSNTNKYLVKLKKMTFTADLIISKISAIFVELGKAFFHAHQHELAEVAWNNAAAIAYQDKDNSYYPQVLREISIALAKAQQWERAKALIDTIEERGERIEALSELGTLLMQEQQLKQAEEVWAKAEGVINQIEQSVEQGEVLVELGTALAHEQQWELAQAVVHSIERHPQRVLAFGELGKVFVQERQVELAQTVWDEACAGTDSIAQDEQDFWVLEKLVEIFAETRQWERADAMVLLLGENDVDDSALNTLGKELTQVQLWEQAQAAVLTINQHDTVNSYSNNLHEEVLNDLLDTLLQGQQWKYAEELAHGLTSDGDKLWALCNLGIELAHAQMQERAEVILNEAEMLARTFTEDTQRVWSLSILGTALAEAQLLEGANVAWDEAEALVHTFAISITSRDSEAYTTRGDQVLEARISALSALLTAFIEAQMWERAQVLAHTITDSKERDSALSYLWRALIKAQLWERANVIVHALKQPSEKVRALSELGTGLAQVQLLEQAKTSWAEAEGMAYTITDSKERDSALSYLWRSLIQTQLWEQIDAIVQKLEQPSEKVRALSELGTALTQAQLLERAEDAWTEAEDLEYSITDGSKQEEALKALVRSLTQAEQWDRAQNALVALQKNRQSRFSNDTWNWELQQLVKGLTQVGLWDRAEAVADLSAENRQRVGVLRQNAAAMVAAGDYEQLLQLVHRLWLQTDNKEYAIRLLPLAYGLVPLKLDIGAAFYEAFTWADNVLKG